jgi:HD superfamily phosphohydrolase
MNITDPLYGTFHIPEPIRSLCQTPEVRRLSQIRLLNTLTPSLATLGELRRFSHTLGVLYLASRNRYIRDAHDRDAFSAAVLLHDIGTPPFGHLLEYHLKERFGWSHESVIKDILNGHHVPENRAHQIFAKQTARFMGLLKKTRIDFGVVRDIVSGSHPLSLLLFGTLDFDNLDNVARMNWALGQLPDALPILRLAENIGISETGQLTLPAGFDSSVEGWMNLRRKAYEVIVFDPPTVAAQAVLSSALERALEAGVLQEMDWSLTDEGLIELLLSERLTKNAISVHYLGRLPELVFMVQIRGGLETFNLSSRTELTKLLLDFLRRRLGRPALGYVFVDKGTFSKQLTLKDAETGQTRKVGDTSRSLVLYAFSLLTGTPSHKKCLSVLNDAIKELGIPGEMIVRCQIGAKSNASDLQQTLKIQA